MNALRRHAPLVLLVILALILAAICGVLFHYVDGMVITGSLVLAVRPLKMRCPICGLPYSACPCTNPARPT